MNDSLSKIRMLIDKIDKQIIKSLNERGRLAKKIKQAKSFSSNKILFRPEREAQILRNIEKLNDGPLLDKHVQIIFREIISSCLSLETELKVSCLGPEQSYSNIALNKFFGSSVLTHFSDSLEKIFSDVKRKNIDFGIVPIENSSQGSIKETIEYLISDGVKICGEVNLFIQHCVLSNAKKTSDIKKIYAHEQTFLQCNNWISKNIPNAKRVFVSSNSAAAKKASKLTGSAAIASNTCSLFYKIPILKKNINDNIDNMTRFIVIGNQVVEPSGSDKTSILVSVDNKAGALNNLLSCLAKKNISMSKIESIPTKINNWEYMFLLDIDGHVKEKIVSNTLKQIEQKSVFYLNLGSYPKSI